MIYVLAESWGLCDFRGIVGPFKSVDQAAEAVFCMPLEGIEGDVLRNPAGVDGVTDGENALGAWYSAQDGMCAAHRSRDEAVAWLRAECGDLLVKDETTGKLVSPRNSLAWGAGPVYLGRIVRVVGARSDLSEALLVVIECDPADVVTDAAHA